jgi:hypothetical protein
MVVEEMVMASVKATNTAMPVFVNELLFIFYLLLKELHKKIFL